MTAPQVELKTGETYRGTLVEAEDNWNSQMKDITVTGRVRRLRVCAEPAVLAVVRVSAVHLGMPQCCLRKRRCKRGDLGYAPLHAACCAAASGSVVDAFVTQARPVGLRRTAE